MLSKAFASRNDTSNFNGSKKKRKRTASIQPQTPSANGAQGQEPNLSTATP